VGNGSTAAAEVVIKEGITKEMLVTTSFFYRRERERLRAVSAINSRRLMSRVTSL
jgi:hypothetical protein